MSQSFGMEAFYTREKANEGIQVPLYLPNGKKSEHWIRIRGIDSDHFRIAESDSRRDAMRIASIESAEDRAKEIEAAKRELLAHLVIAWSFDQECTLENAKRFFQEAPQVADALDRVASKRTLFFEAGSKPSLDSPKPNSDSTSDQPDPSKLSEKA